jgi:hypothetical protein
MEISEKIVENAQILFSKDAGIFVGRITEIREKSVKVDYCFESAWGNNSMTVYTYTTWIPKSVLILDEHEQLTVKKWFAKSGLDGEKIFHIKKYFMKGDEKIML